VLEDQVEYSYPYFRGIHILEASQYLSSWCGNA